ncbi:MAG TPA: hypothetical protein VH880_02745 [Anaeromyxobacteraceae bacterium]|jgi:hypothetical protein
MASSTVSLSPRSLAAGRSRSALLDGAVLVAVWVALWTFFALGVLRPAAGLEIERPAAERPA